jgi:Organic solute transporter Ostalpha
MMCRVALYGLLLFYGLMKEELKGRRPLAKFLAIKLIVMFTFYQSFVVSPSLSPPHANPTSPYSD